jgi:hypothetical protein
MTSTILDMEFCVGNSHALITYQRSNSTADCECGNALILVKGERFGSANPVWVHGVNWSRCCPPYECECGQRHNRKAPTSPTR